jgi:hypothetical protein
MSDQLRDVLHDAWLTIHVRRFDADNFDGERPDYVSSERAVDSFYAGIQKAEAMIAEVAAKHGIDWLELRQPATPAPPVTDPNLSDPTPEEG